jgi:hypothetical protein
MSSGITIDEICQEVRKIRTEMVKREDLEALSDSIAILSKTATTRSIKKSECDIWQGRVKTITSVDDLLSECA